MNTPEIDWEEINARLDALRAEAREQLKAERTHLLAALRELGVQRIEACYNGYAHSGNAQCITVAPEVETLDDLDARVSDFVWGMVYDLHLGFEIDDGREGTLIWDMVEDRLDVVHADFYTARDEHLHEDI